MTNPFERFELDPRSTTAEITERMRELVETAPACEHEAIRAAWEALTLHPRERIAAAVHCFVDLEPAPEPPPHRLEPRPSSPDASLLDLFVAPRLEASLASDEPEPRDAFDLDRDPWPRELLE